MPSSTSSSERATAVAAAAALLLVGAAEAGIALRFGRALLPVEAVPFHQRGAVPTVEESIIEWQVLDAWRGIGAQDVVFAGDSSCLMGVQADAFEGLTGLRTRNLATMGWLGLQGQADVVRIALEHAPAPRLVVVQAAWLTLTFDQSDFDRTDALARFRSWIGREPPPAIAPPSRRHRDALLAGLRAGLHGGALEDDHLRRARGAYPSHEDMGRELRERQGSFTELRPVEIARVPAVREPMTDEALDGLAAVAEVAAAAGAELRFVLAPLPDASRTPEADALLAEARARMEQRLGPQVVVAGTWGRFYSEEQFATPTHLTAEGAARNTREIAQALGVLRTP